MRIAMSRAVCQIGAISRRSLQDQKRLACFAAPADQAARAVLSKAHGHEPEGKAGMVPLLLHDSLANAPELAKGGDLLDVKLLDPLQLPGRSVAAAEEELEQELVPHAGGPGRLLAPARERLASLLRDLVDVAIAAAGGPPRAPPDESLGLELLQRRIDLPEALAPEVADARFRLLPDVVSRHGSEAEHAQDRVGGGACACVHIAIRYISRRCIVQLNSPPQIPLTIQ